MPDMTVKEFVEKYGVSGPLVMNTLNYQIPRDAWYYIGNDRFIRSEYLEELGDLLNQHIAKAQGSAVATSTITSVILTSSYNIEGYRIVQYKDFISSEAVLGMGMFKAFSASFADMTGTESEALNTKLKEGRDLVKRRIKKAASDLGCNAVIGADIDLTMFSGSLLGVVINGTAVVIEKEEGQHAG
jgi:uncharacterized protein YbjQ (UPF0145 family)